MLHTKLIHAPESKFLRQKACRIYYCDYKLRNNWQTKMTMFIQGLVNHITLRYIIFETWANNSFFIEINCIQPFKPGKN